MNLIPSNIFLILFLFGFASCTTSVDIRNDYLKKGITEEDILKGKDLLNKMEDACGGRQNWSKYTYGIFIQKADWYGRTKISSWDTLPQLFQMTCKLESNDSELILLNGKNKGSKFWINGDIYSAQKLNDDIVKVNKNPYHEKMIFKNYWFQFAFRIGEAQIISYAGEEKINDKTYNVLYATWGEETANKNYDQFLLYLDQSTNQLEILHFTVRDKMRKVSLTAEFKDFRKVNDFELPFSQFVKYGKPGADGVKFHENHYQAITFE